jgi:hypothetical protein
MWWHKLTGMSYRPLYVSRYTLLRFRLGSEQTVSVVGLDPSLAEAQSKLIAGLIESHQLLCAGANPASSIKGHVFPWNLLIAFQTPCGQLGNRSLDAIGRSKVGLLHKLTNICCPCHDPGLPVGMPGSR